MAMGAGTRIIVIGTPSAGKTTLARNIAGRLGLAHIELDAINWQPDWRDLDRHDQPEFVRRVTLAVQAKRWVADGNYASVRDMLWRHATHLLWLDYERPVIMAQVIARSVYRATLGGEVWAGTGNREHWHDFMRPSHPIRWAWSTWRQRRRQTEERLRQPEFAQLIVLRLRRPAEAKRVLIRLQPGGAAIARRYP